MNHIKKKQAPKQPFFTRFLEEQKLQEVTGGGGPLHTLKFPSDNDEDQGQTS